MGLGVLGLWGGLFLGMVFGGGGGVVFLSVGAVFRR
jgi:hypothetical protein